MDKYEYNLKLDQLKNLVEAEDYETAAEIANSINWKKVRSSRTLIMVSQIYEKTEQYDACKDVLLQAYDHSSIGRNIVSRLVDIAIKSKNTAEAEEYYQEFLEVSPKDNQRYIFAYKISCLKDAPLSDRIAILEEFKEKEYTEIWAYELAALYGQAGMREKCVATCDELVLWFGEGDYVEKALDLKRSFQPLTVSQEEKYRKLRSRRGMVEVNVPKKVEANISAESGLPEIKVTASKFNTQNLQEELAKSMAQIMSATEKETVKDSMAAIKKIVQDIPYLNAESGKEDGSVFDRDKINEQVDEDLKADFKELLEEDADGQIRLQIPESTIDEQQVAGQMSIEEVLTEWEKTKHAAEAAIAAAEQKKLDMAKEQALAEANDIMARLQALFPLLSATPGKDIPEAPETVAAELIPDVPAAAGEEKNAGGAIAAGEEKSSGDAIAPGEEKSSGDAIASEEGQIPKQPSAAGASDSTSYKKEAEGTSGSEAGVTAGSAEGIPDADAAGLSIGDADETAVGSEAGVPAVSKEGLTAEGGEKETAGSEEETTARGEEDVSAGSEAGVTAGDADKVTVGRQKEAALEEVSAKENAEVSAAATREMPDMASYEKTVLPVAESPKFESPSEDEELEKLLASATRMMMENASVEVPVSGGISAEKMPASEQEELPDLITPEELIDEPVPDDAAERAEEGTDAGVMTEENRQLFSYFLPVPGMQEQIEQILEDAVRYKSNAITSLRGNLLIQGEEGSGKTVLATSLIKAIQRIAGNEDAKIGKISAASLNTKDFAALVPKLAGGYLIVDRAGELTKATVARMSQIMERNTQGMVVILEDDSAGIRRAMDLDFSFAKKFTGKVKIPVFTIDELVVFGKAYALEMECVIEEIGVLALYNRINNIQKLDHPTTIAEVKEIVDQAIVSAEGRGLRKLFTKKYDENDYLILRENDFA
ncbi:MAG: hypothetical protein LIO75_07300 [Lachnospiraceae bacterium]|nr:hypothetical protein [Lachnospiraceae bacterium]